MTVPNLTLIYFKYFSFYAKTDGYNIKIHSFINMRKNHTGSRPL